MLRAFPRAPVIVVIYDNDSIHRARKITACLKEHPRLELPYGALYSRPTTMHPTNTLVQ